MAPKFDAKRIQNDRGIHLAYLTGIGHDGLHLRMYGTACSAIHSDAASLERFTDGTPSAMRFIQPKDVLFQELYGDTVYALMLDTMQLVNREVSLNSNIDSFIELHGERRDIILKRSVEILELTREEN